MIARGLVCAALLSFAAVASSEEPGGGTYKYQPGEVVADFSTVLRRAWWNPNRGEFVQAGGTIHLSDFEGKILFILFYDPFCSICLEGIHQTTASINDYYKERNGNANGIPVVYMAINLESAEYARYEADNVLAYYSVDVRANDYTETDVDVAVRLFATHTSKPVFVAINGVANSPSHRQWELLINKSGVVESQIPGLITTWQGVIDSVEAPPPALENVHRRGEGVFEFTLYGQLNSTYRVASTTNFLDWDFGAPFIGTNGPVVLPFNTDTSARRFFRVVSP